MCTLILAWQVFDGTPIVVAANRDEALGRPARPPGVLDEDPTVVAPRDEEAGGTWVGYNDAGLFVGVTNRRTDREGERSRGLLVRDALARESAADASSFVRNELAAREYAGFNLVVADADAAELLEWDGVLQWTHFEPGVHVVVNEGHDGSAPKAERVRDAVDPVPNRDSVGSAEPAPSTSVEEWFERAKDVLRDHGLGTCVHRAGFGTRSSSVIAVDADANGRYWFADGRPCETDYERVTVGGEADDQI